ncbi:hypothetical protein FDUTEX481_01448 [Tolypothrix sp. PCC 7601]|nr:hypothetical protein FDUTEX481_01448 [Tolypothrix sp. PCC 7601]
MKDSIAQVKQPCLPTRNWQTRVNLNQVFPFILAHGKNASTQIENTL